MNREIKFRAWDKETNQWCDNNRIIINANGKIWHRFGDELTNKVIIQQFTGLKDKNGKEIFEGDMVVPYYGVKNTKGYPCIVDWRSNTGFHPFVGTRISNEKWEIIGNIYENPRRQNRENH